MTVAIRTNLVINIAIIRKTNLVLSIAMVIYKSKPGHFNETGSRSPCMRPRSDPPNFGPITKRIGW